MDEWYNPPVTPPEQSAQPEQLKTSEPPDVPEQPPLDSRAERPQQPEYFNPQPIYAPYSPEKPPQKKGNDKLVWAIIGSVLATVVVMVSILLIIGFQNGSFLRPSLDFGQADQNEPNTNPNAPTLQITELDEDAQGLSTTEIVDRNLNSTVLLSMYTASSTNGFPFGQSADQEQSAGVASGIVMSQDGYIITNWHCVVDESTGEEFPRIDVTMYDGTVYEYAEIIGYDSATDLAVIKVKATDLKPAEFGDSNQLKMGNKVVALGNSGGLGFSTTQGIVSGLARDVYEDTGYAIKCLQIDAAINPGNSGGPLFNAAGQVIAVNSAKIVADGYEGIGFSIPINEAKVIIDDILKNGYVTGRVALGITGQTYADAYYRGFLIQTINHDSPLQQTDVRRGDLIVGVDGVEVENYAELRAELAKHKVGDTITLKLLRSSNRKVTEFTVTVKLAEAKGD